MGPLLRGPFLGKEYESERSASLTTQIAQLVSLQELDQRLQQKSRKLEELHEQIATIAAEKELHERNAEEREKHIGELEMQQREVDGLLKLEEEKIKEKRVRLNRVRNEKELLVLQREIEMMKEANGELEEKVLVVMGHLEEERQLYEETRAKVAELTGQLSTEKAAVEGQIATLEEEAEAGRKTRQKITSGLDAGLCARYDRIFGNRGALAVVEVKDETCQGCHMRIPPHMCNQVQSSQMQGKSEIFNCPHPYCGRIVYVELESVEASEV